MILAAGRGERMRPLTDTTPKPLLKAGTHTLIEHTLMRLVQNGFQEIVINHAYLGNQIEHFLGDGSCYGASIAYSREGDEALETGGGILRALSLLGDRPFLVVNGDIATDFPFAQLRNLPDELAHLVLVNNPPQHPSGDFALNGTVVIETSSQRLTFSGIGVYKPELFAGCGERKFALATLLKSAIKNCQVSGEKYDGFWMDIGTPERLEILSDIVKCKAHTVPTNI